MEKNNWSTRVLFIAGALLTSLFSDAGAQWVQANGPYGGNIHCLTVSGPNLFAGVSGGVYFSTNNGTSWSALNAGMTNDSVLSFAIIGTNLFAGTSGGVFSFPRTTAQAGMRLTMV